MLTTMPPTAELPPPDVRAPNAVAAPPATPAQTAAPAAPSISAGELRRKQRAAALAFNGYGPKNLGRSQELLAHPAYGPIVRKLLATGSELCSAALGQRVDLVQRVAAGRETELADYGEAIALVVTIELAQLKLLHDYFGIDHRRMRLAFGYSLGEVTALIASGVFELEEVLPPLLSLADECVTMAHDLSVGMLLFRGPALVDEAHALCAEITEAGEGAVAVSAHLAPNALLLIGQRNTLDRFESRIADVLGSHVHLRRLKDKWPPLHTPLMKQRRISDKVAARLADVSGGFRRPDPPVLSLVTGEYSYDETNSRETLTAWIDRPQLLCDTVHEVLASGVDVVIHVGPRPELVPTTFSRLSSHVSKQLGERSLNALGMRALGGLVRHPWFTRHLFSRTALLRAPHVAHVILEDWLLQQTP